MATLFDNLVRSTCRILATDPNGDAQVGTAFFYSFPRGDLRGLVLVSNRHVIEGMARAEFILSHADADGKEIERSHLKVELTELQGRAFYHPNPSIDLACLFVADVIEEFSKRGKPPAFLAFREEDIPPADMEFTAIEDVLMVGYPTGLFDASNNRPIVRRGITASSFNLDYCGRPEFLIDAACFPGSSGSPVMIANSGSFTSNEGITIGSRFFFLGVLWGGPQFTAAGEIQPVPIPTAASYLSQMAIPMNLGFCVKARQVKVMVDALLASHEPPPA